MSASGGVTPILGQALGVMDERTRVLANDIANAATPGFQAQDVTFQGLLDQQMGQSPGANALDGVVVSAPGLMPPDANGVDMEATLVDLEENATNSQGIGQTLADRFQAQQNVISNMNDA